MNSNRSIIGCELLADGQGGAISGQRRIHLQLVGEGIADQIMAGRQLLPPLGVQWVVRDNRPPISGGRLAVSNCLSALPIMP